MFDLSFSNNSRVDLMQNNNSDNDEQTTNRHTHTDKNENTEERKTGGQENQSRQLGACSFVLEHQSKHETNLRNQHEKHRKEMCSVVREESSRRKTYKITLQK